MIIFNQLSMQRKKNAVKAKGFFLAKLERKKIIVLLYSMDGYFIDVFCRRENMEIIQMRAFESPKRLYKYQLNYRDFGKSFMDLDLEE